MVEVGEDVVDTFDAYGEPDQARRHAGGELLLGGQLRVRRRRRMDHQRSHVTDIGDVAVQLQRIDESLACLDAAGQFECQHCAGSLGRQLLTQLIPR